MRRIQLSLIPLAFVLFFFIPTAQAQSNGEYDCSSHCAPYSSCDEPCTACSGGPECIDTYCCSGYNWTTCGEAGMTCGGCAITNTWTVDEEVSRYPVYGPGGPYFCGGSRSWYGYVNWSVFVQYNKQMRRVTYGTRTCGGSSQTVVVSQSYFTDECYDFVYPHCCQPSQQGCDAPEWRFNPQFEFPSYMECEW